MTKTSRPERASLSAAVERRPRRFSFVWLLPFIALMIGGWMIYNSFIEKDIIIQIHFESGAGLVAGKTQVKHKGVILGVLKKFYLDDDLKGVIATVGINRNAETALRDGTLFWLVEPRISLEGITGLETLVSGAYIEIRPGQGKPSLNFKALSSPPPLPLSEPGLHLVVTTNSLGSIRPGSPILHRKVVVGSVQSHEFNPKNTGIRINIHIKSKYADLVSPCSKFWNSSGISLSGDLGGLTLRAESLMSIIAGGISFYTPASDKINVLSQCRNGDTFVLYDDYQSANAGIVVSIAFDSATGLNPNKTKVLYKGVEVGVLKRIDINKTLDGVVGEFHFDPQTQAALNDTTRFWAVKPRLSFTEISGLDTLLSGIYLEMDFELQGQPKTDFTLLKEPPLHNGDRTGLIITLKSESLGSITRGTPLLYKRIKVGSVLSYHLSEDKRFILIDANVENAYASLVRSDSRFWNSSGITVKGSLQGLEIHSESLESLLSGGISFETPSDGGRPASHRQSFTLFTSREAALTTGIPIRIRFSQGHGLKKGAPIRYRDVDMGRITAIQADPSLASVMVHALLDPEAGDLARSGSRFWVVRPALGVLATSNLETLITGRYITVLPGRGEPAAMFAGLDQPPVDHDRPDGLPILLSASRLGSIKKGNPIFYKDVPVGKVVDFRLADSADRVLIEAVIAVPYKPLVRTNSRFWNVSGMNFDFGLFRGAHFEMNSLESLIEGGIAFASPEQPELGVQAQDHQTFEIYDAPEKAWLNWSPAIPINE